ncbi:FAD-dependent oxidoreductase [Nakamurella antarctica]|uniref:FAD-dependent oxidoreductase n=1 Tax=Nakamurella antarctica TaxID=1902245 RepID=A0A3G8ZPN1_9ACTN|nr:FAD-dependent oxidoreductase [Nakamurella antarctica]AZI58747.1 FAD-dependent oxidoreductase [Nakamurella antarctica]
MKLSNTEPIKPQRAVVVGAGMVGLSTAWFLQDAGVEVVVIDREGVAAGSSWGNAGWISPGLAIPLAEPSVLRYGVKALLDKNSPLYIPFKVDPALWRFMLGFARRCTMSTWRKTMASYVPVNQMAIAGFDELAAGGVTAPTLDAPIMAAFAKESDSGGLIAEIGHIREAGLDLLVETIDGAALRAQVPIVAGDVEMAIKISGQQYINPGEYLKSLAASFVAKGGQIKTGSAVRTINAADGGVVVEMADGAPVRGDAVVIATGAWLPDLAKQFGVKVPMVAGRGYSFSVPVEKSVPCPVYFPLQRIACTPLGDRLRVAGTMEFRNADDPIYQARVESIVTAGRPLLTGVDWDNRQDTWVGSRPVTVDSLPLVGATKVPGVYVAGGHGMWGVSLGPITGKLLAEQMMTGKVPAALAPFNPVR